MRYDPELWFPLSERPGTIELPTSLCQQCPVRVECLQGALDRRERWGIWGGFTTYERQASHPARLMRIAVNETAELVEYRARQAQVKAERQAPVAVG
jgi:WhiB family redox-sensing transcriptional regulator